jgi:hypothetical protein
VDGELMADVVFIAVILGFFGLAMLLVKACDRIIGRDLIPLDADASAEVASHPIERVA